MASLFKKDEICVITSIADTEDGYVMVGSVKNANYRVLLMKTNKKMQKIWKKSHGAESKDYEGHNIVPIKDGYLICGCSEGHASINGGSDWKAYILKVDRSGNIVWEKSYRINGNECAYSLAVDDNILLFGETSSSPEKRHLLLMKVDTNGEIIWHKIFETGEEITPGGLIKEDSGYIIAGSFMRNGKWNTSLKKVDKNGEVLMEVTFDDVNVFDICEIKDGYAMTGSRGEYFYLIKIDRNGNKIWDNAYDRGCGAAIERSGDKLMVAGSIEKNELSLPVLYKINQDGSVEWNRTYEKEGFIETLKQVNEGFILIRHILIPKEYSDIIEVDENGLPN